MDPLTHVATGVVCSQLVSSPSRWWAALAGVLFALLPDVDYFYIFWDRLAFIRYHRGFTHSLVAVPLFALAGAWLARILGGPRWFKPVLLIGVIVLASHLVLDLATSYGTQILSPFSRRRFTLDWIFIIDPYLTALLVVGAISALALHHWGPRLGAAFLAAAILYMLACGFYHHQAQTLARQVFQAALPPGGPGVSSGQGHTQTHDHPKNPLHSPPYLQTTSSEQVIAALPQPFSCRRWQLIAAAPGEIRQAFVQLPVTAGLGEPGAIRQVENVSVPQGQDCLAPHITYQAPDHLTVQTWTPVAAAAIYPREAEKILTSYLEFARFPLLCRAQSHEDEQVLEWLDLRFSIPGRSFPFVLQLRLDARGRLLHWLIGRRG